MTRDSAPCQKWAKRVVFCCSFKYYGRRETLEEGLLRCISHGRCRTRDVPIRHVRSQGADFLRRVAFWSIRSSGLRLPRWWCVTGATLRMTWPHSFVAGAIHRNTFWESAADICKSNCNCDITDMSDLQEASQKKFSTTKFELRLAEKLRFSAFNFWICFSALNFHFWRKSRGIAWCLTL